MGSLIKTNTMDMSAADVCEHYQVSSAVAEKFLKFAEARFQQWHDDCEAAAQSLKAQGEIRPYTTVVFVATGNWGYVNLLADDTLLARRPRKDINLLERAAADQFEHRNFEREELETAMRWVLQ